MKTNGTIRVLIVTKVDVVRSNKRFIHIDLKDYFTREPLYYMCFTFSHTCTFGILKVFFYPKGLE